VALRHSGRPVTLVMGWLCKDELGSSTSSPILRDTARVWRPPQVLRSPHPVGQKL